MDDFEDRLRRFRPVGPPPELRARVLSTAGERQPSLLCAWWPAAATATAAIVLYALAANARRDIGVPPAEQERRGVVEAIAQAFGGDAQARALAEHAIALRVLYDDDTDPPQPFDGKPQ